MQEIYHPSIIMPLIFFSFLLSILVININVALNVLKLHREKNNDDIRHILFIHPYLLAFLCLYLGFIIGFLIHLVLAIERH